VKTFQSTPRTRSCRIGLLAFPKGSGSLDENDVKSEPTNSDHPRLTGNAKPAATKVPCPHRARLTILDLKYSTLASPSLSLAGRVCNPYAAQKAAFIVSAPGIEAFSTKASMALVTSDVRTNVEGAEWAESSSMTTVEDEAMPEAAAADLDWPRMIT
jgi:hypothetical protein